MAINTVTAIAYLLSEALAAGASMKAIMEATQATGKVPTEMWEQIMTEMDEARAELGLN